MPTYVFHQADEPRAYDKWPCDDFVTVRNHKIDTRNLTDTQYRKALSYGIAKLLRDKELELKNIIAKD